MPTELEFYKVKNAIAKGMYGDKAITDAQFAKCHAVALNVFEALGTPAYLYDEKFMSRKAHFDYIDSSTIHTGYRHEIRTALDMVLSGFATSVSFQDVRLYNGETLVMFSSNTGWKSGNTDEETIGLWLAAIAGMLK